MPAGPYSSAYRRHLRTVDAARQVDLKKYSNGSYFASSNWCSTHFACEAVSRTDGPKTSTHF